MNNRDLLDILGEIDEELIEDAAPVASAERVARPKKFNFGWIKPVAVAASCVIILSGAMIARPLLDMINSPDIYETGDNDSQSEAEGDIDEGVNESPEDQGSPSIPNFGGNVEGEPPEDVQPDEFGSGDEDGDINDSPYDEPVDEGVSGPLPAFAAIIESVGTLNFAETVRYRENILGFAPSRFTLNADLLQGIADVLYSCNGLRVYGVNVDALADEMVVLEHVGKNSVGFAVYSNGYIGVHGIYYYIGEEYTQKIINIVKTEGESPEGIYWNEDDECWQTYGHEDEEFYEDIDSDTAIESERDE